MTSAPVNTVISGRAAICAFISAASSAPFRPCGYIRPIFATWPPSSASRSTRKTPMPMSARPIAARMPATPPPMTSDFLVVSTTIGSSGSDRRVRAMPALIRPMALFVVPSASSVWIHEACSRTLTWLYSNWLRPARLATPRKVVTCSFGEQDATTRPSSCCSSMSRSISDWLASEQANIVWRATTTPGSCSTAPMTRSMST